MTSLCGLPLIEKWDRWCLSKWRPKSSIGPSKSKTNMELLKLVEAWFAVSDFLTFIGSYDEFVMVIVDLRVLPL